MSNRLLQQPIFGCCRRRGRTSLPRRKLVNRHGQRWVGLCKSRRRNAALIVNYEVSAETGRFTGASGNLTMTATTAPGLRNDSNAPALLTNTGEFEGTIVKAAHFLRNLRAWMLHGYLPRTGGP
jgi:hypothetical protein